MTNSNIKSTSVQDRAMSSHLAKLIAVTIPLALSQLSEMAMGVIDTILLGSIGVTALAVGGLANNFFLCSWVICQTILAGIAILLSRSRGQRDHGHEISHVSREVVSAGLTLAFAVFVPCFAFLYSSHALFAWLGEPAAVTEYGSHFVSILLLSLLPDLMVIGVCRMALPALGAESILLWTFPFLAIINAIGNYGLIYGKFGLPKLGLYGSAWATSLTSIAIAVVLIGFCVFRKDLRAAMMPCKFKFETFKSIVRLGFPIMIAAASEIILFQITTLWAGKLGTDPLAAHQVALNMISLFFMVCLGIGQATNIRVAYWHGAEKKRQALRTTVSGLVVVLGWTMITGTLLIVFPSTIAGWYFLGNPPSAATFATAVTLLRIGGIFQIVDGIQTVCGGALRGLGDVVYPMVLGITSYGIIGLSLGYYLAFDHGDGAAGLWIGLSAGLAMTSVFFGTRLFFVFKKMPNEVEAA